MQKDVLIVERKTANTLGVLLPQSCSFFVIVVPLIVGISNEDDSDNVASQTIANQTTSAKDVDNLGEDSNQAENVSETQAESKGSVSTSKAEDNTFKVGETMKTDDISITFKSVEDYVSDNEFITPEDGNKFIRVYFVIENIGKTDELVSEYEFKCYADNNAIDISLYGDEKVLSSATLSPGRKAEGYIYYEVPTDAENIEIEYETNFWTENKAIFVVK